MTSAHSWGNKSFILMGKLVSAQQMIGCLRQWRITESRPFATVLMYHVSTAIDIGDKEKNAFRLRSRSLEVYAICEICGLGSHMLTWWFNIIN